MKPKIGILTTFWNMDPGFSLCTVVIQQLTSLVRQGFTPVLFVLTNFSQKEVVPEGVEVRRVIPQLLLEPYGVGDLSHLEEDVTKTVPALEEHLSDIDVCLTHDIIFINSYLPYNVALRRAIAGKLAHVKWLHWMHSGPSFHTLDGSVFDNLYTLPPNSRLIYMNHTDVIRAAEMYHTLPKNVRVIFNPMDIRELYDFQPLTRRLIDAYDLMTPDFLAVYPLSTTRMDTVGKQLSKALRVMAELKKRGFSVRYVIPNAHANAPREKQAIEEMYQLATRYGLERTEVVFTSLFETSQWESGVPHTVVKDLFLLSNLFLFPSYSENCPLVLLEAMAGKNLLVLNQDFPAIKDFAYENALYFRFASTVAPEPQFPNGLDTYYKDVALLIASEMDQNKALKAQTHLRQQFNGDYIATHQLIPAIMELYAG